MQIRLTAAAEQDLLDGFVFYESQQETIGAYFLDSLYADIDSLIVYAGIHPKPVGRFHRALAKRFPFAIYYEFANQIVTVVAVLDCRQDPSSITARLT